MDACLGSLSTFAFEGGEMRSLCGLMEDSGSGRRDEVQR
jgi:hypothetical protein